MRDAEPRRWLLLYIICLVHILLLILEINPQKHHGDGDLVGIWRDAPMAGGAPMCSAEEINNQPTNELIDQSINYPMSKTACVWASGAMVSCCTTDAIRNKTSDEMARKEDGETTIIQWNNIFGIHTHLQLKNQTTREGHLPENWPSQQSATTIHVSGFCCVLWQNLHIFGSETRIQQPCLPDMLCVHLTFPIGFSWQRGGSVNVVL
jgi:hypothetical protein